MKKMKYTFYTQPLNEINRIYNPNFNSTNKNEYEIEQYQTGPCPSRLSKKNIHIQD